MRPSRRPGTWLPCLLVAALASLPVQADEGPSRAAVQAGAKDVLRNTGLSDEVVSALHAELEAGAARWAKHVLEAGGAALVDTAARERALKGFQKKLDERGASLAEQTSLVEVAEARFDATLRDFKRLLEYQGRVKHGLEDAGLEEPALMDTFRRAQDFVDAAHAWVQADIAAGADREPAIDVVKREFAPLLEEAQLSDRNVAKLSEALAEWLKARATLEAEAAP